MALDQMAIVLGGVCIGVVINPHGDELFRCYHCIQYKRDRCKWCNSQAQLVRQMCLTSGSKVIGLGL